MGIGLYSLLNKYDNKTNCSITKKIKYWDTYSKYTKKATLEMRTNDAAEKYRCKDNWSSPE